MFTLIYGKQGREEHDTLEIVYSDRQQPVKYRVEWEDERGCNVLKEKGRQQSQSELKAMEVSILALAAATPVWAGTAKTLPLSKTLETFPPPQPNKDVTQDFIISDLQNERSSVGTKIKALDALANWPDDDIRRLASKITPKEPMLATLIDLGRHSDKELASKARRVTARVDIEKLLERSLRSDEQLQVKGALTTLQRIEKNQALQILERADAKKSPSLKAFSEQIQSGKATQLLRPVGSAGGDRYYVKAEWNPQDSSAVECLTELFNRRLLARRSLEEEREFMEKRQERYVYWYDKDWALDMAMEIERCGGTASFVAP